MEEKVMTKRYKLYVISREFFQGFLLVYMLATVAEIFKSGIISNYINSNYILLVVLVSGILMVISEKKEYEYKLSFKNKQKK